MEIRAGTSGYSYKEWKGGFYPEKLAAKDMLAYYAERLPCVEINNTFYRMPKKSVLEGWAEQVPEHFRFVVKASRRITHFKRLKETDEELGFLLGNLAVLGERLGAVLFQLPPNLKCDLERLDAFLARLPEGGRYAFEFRHASWLDEPAVAERLAARNAARVLVDGAEAPEATAEAPEATAGTLEATADWGYLRLRREDYAAADLAAWLQRMRATGWRQAFAFFKHEDASAGPRLARQLLDLAARERPAAAARPARRRTKRDAG
jgi:uncharacterized protein YecE (DUF72 family)